VNVQVDRYLSEGCGRCPLGGTPQCKVHRWPDELKALRSIAVQSGLTEELKWGVPCYTYQKHNVAIIAAFREYCSISFFKGVLLDDPDGMLQSPGENSQAVRLMRFTSVAEIKAKKRALTEFLRKAIELEQAGLKVDFKAKSELVFPEELEIKMNALPALRSAFTSLTPGRQRGYILYFTAAKQAQTRHSRIEKCLPAILEGRGLHD
jgi:uncharacterized protein YdeI (YjbR/CyaY-like superfamily)